MQSSHKPLSSHTVLCRSMRSCRKSPQDWLEAGPTLTNISTQAQSPCAAKDELRGVGTSNVEVEEAPTAQRKDKAGQSPIQQAGKPGSKPICQPFSLSQRSPREWEQTDPDKHSKTVAVPCHEQLTHHEP